MHTPHTSASYLSAAAKVILEARKASPSDDVLFLLLGQVAMSIPRSAPPVTDSESWSASTLSTAARPRCAPPPPWKAGDPCGWPYVSYLEFAALPTAPSCARSRAKACLDEWKLSALRENTELVLSELATNAVLASRTAGTRHPVIRLWLLGDAARLVIVVWDASGNPPEAAEVPVAAEHGRGLQIVAALSSHCGWYTRSDSAGKCVWAELAEDIEDSRREETGADAGTQPAPRAWRAHRTTR
jgi:hypothetical protein